MRARPHLESAFRVSGARLIRSDLARGGGALSVGGGAVGEEQMSDRVRDRGGRGYKGRRYTASPVRSK